MIDKKNFLVVLAGTSKYCPSMATVFEPLPQVANNIKRFFGTLIDPDILGLPLQNIDLVLEPNAKALFESIRLAREREPDYFLFYYSGHGEIRSGRLILPTCASTIDDIENTSICSNVLAKKLDEFQATKTLTILDCCFSKQYSGNASFDQIATAASTCFAETISITSARGFADAINPTDARFTLFSGELFKALNQGIVGGCSTLTAIDIFKEVKRRIKFLGGPKPDIRGDGFEFPFVNNMQSGLVQGGRLDTMDALFKYLCEARGRCQQKIRLMQIRKKPPVVIEDGEVVRHADGRHKLIIQSEFAEVWYDGLVTWGSQAGHQFERITLGTEESLIYAKAVQNDAKKAKSAMTIRLLNNQVTGLPAYNFCIFDENEMTITYGRPYGDSGLSVWFRDPRIVGFFSDVYNHIKSEYTHSIDA